MAKTVLRLDKIGADTHIVSFKAHKELENGMLVGLKGLVTGEGEVYEVEDVKATSDTIVMVSCVGLEYNESKGEEEFSLAKGCIGRGYILRKGDMVTISDVGIDGGSSTVNKYYVATASKQKLVQGDTKGALELNFKALRKESYCGQAGVLLEVI